MYHLGFEIPERSLLNGDGDANASLGDVADWLTYFYIGPVDDGRMAASTAS